MAIVTDWNKYKKYFKESEFASKDRKDGKAFISDILMDMLYKARTLTDKPYIITSGGRSPQYNETITSAKNSDHLADEKNICYGVDIAVNSDAFRFQLITDLISVGFDRIGIGKGFVHAGIGKGYGGRNASDVSSLY
jgi:hypothetical protein